MQGVVMYCKELTIYFNLHQYSSRSIQANVADCHAKLGKNISRETILGMVIIIFDFRSFEKSELTKFTHSFFCYQLEEQLEVENVKIRKGNKQENCNLSIVLQSRKKGWEKIY